MKIPQPALRFNLSLSWRQGSARNTGEIGKAFNNSWEVRRPVESVWIFSELRGSRGSQLRHVGSLSSAARSWILPLHGGTRAHPED